MENCQTLWLPFEIAPVRVCLSDVPAEDDLFLLWYPLHEERKVRSERARVGRRDQNGKGILAHELYRVFVVAHAEVFRNVHD